MKRWVFTILSAVSLLLFVAVCVMWVRSYSAVDVLSAPIDSGASRSLASHDGLLVLSRLDMPSSYVRKENKWEWSVQPDSMAIEILRSRKSESQWDVIVLRQNTYLRGKLRLLVGPYWALATGAALLPTLWLITGARSRRRGRTNLCPSCGYDLRATPGRCPECGRVPDIR